MNTSPIDVARRILSELGGMAEHASLTGSLQGGERAAVAAYNRALETLQGQGLVPDGMFEPIRPEEASYGALAVQARLLGAVLGDDGHESEEERRRHKERRRSEDEGLGPIVALAPFLASEDLGQMLHERIDDATEIPDGLLTALAPFLASEDLGQLVRRRMRRGPKATPAPPTPPEPPEPPAPDLRPVPSPPGMLEALAAELRRPDLSTGERQAIATRLAELAYEQATEGR